jgi:protein SCO1
VKRRLRPTAMDHGPSSRSRRAALLAAALALTVTLMAAGSLAGCDAPVPAVPFKAVDITGADYANRLELPDVDGRRRTLDEFKGKLVVVFFGYTQCPDVCPTTLTDLVETQRLLGADGDKLMAVLVTVDPERDTAELLKGYVGNFNPSWLALRGSAEEIAAAARQFKVFYRKAPGQTAESYTVDHTAASYVFDTQGRIRLYVRNGTSPTDLAADLKTLLAQKG